MSRARDLADLGGSADVGGLTGPNMLINGAFTVAQRGTSATATSGSVPLTVDRFSTTASNFDQASLTESQSTTVPSGQGFAHSFKILVGSSAETTLNPDETLYIRYQGIEGQDAQHLAFGTSSAKKTTLSFWVRSGVTGNYAVLMYTNAGIGGGAVARSQTLTYTVNSADTWEFKTITFDGDGASGNALADNTTAELQLYFSLASGSNITSVDGTSWGNYVAGKFAFGQTANLVGTANAAFYITGIKLEVGTAATPFEHESYKTTLAKCQRYFEISGITIVTNITSRYPSGQWAVRKNHRPDITFTAAAGSGATIAPMYDGGNVLDNAGKAAWFQSVVHSIDALAVVYGDAEL
tara:strand:- start:617 stop:1675 length:1059 start_codon:yes stop_codon:yes gene_type:complete